MVKKTTKKARGVKTNRQIKNRMFSMLFGDKESAIGLVNALVGTNYGYDVKAEVTTLENVLTSGPLNDLAILLDDVLLVLIEHQSTVCGNMPYRMLEYVTETYKRLIAGQNIYGERRIKLPRPVFIVLYNGTKKMGARELHRLSASYSKRLPKFAGMGGLELGVTLINLNDARNKNLVKTCKLLSEYCIFINKLRNSPKNMTPMAIVRKVVADCIKENVLKSFLLKHRKELVSMSLTMWDWDTALKFAKEENFEEGMAKGIAKGMAKGIAKGIKKGRADGIGIGVKNTAVAMKREGMPAKTISRLTGLSLYAIRKL